MSEENTQLIPNQSEIVAQRIAKIDTWREAGINPFGAGYPDVQMISDVRAAFVPPADPEADPHAGPEVNVAGRLVAKRGMGKSIFADVRDSSGRIQLFAGKSDLSEEDFATFKRLDIGDIVGIKGRLFVTKMGELTIRVEKPTILSKSLRPLPEKFHGLTDV